MTQFQKKEKEKRNLSVVERKEVKMEAICKTQEKKEILLYSFIIHLQLT